MNKPPKPWTGPINECRLAFGFYTRIPCGTVENCDGADMARALRLGPLVGLCIGAWVFLAFFLASFVGLDSWLAALLAILAGVLLTGALHEDGLADIADGLGVMSGTAARLAAMRDSRLGAFGVLALIFSVGLRSSALATLEAFIPVLLALVAAHGFSRALPPALMAHFSGQNGGRVAAGIDRPRSGDVGLALFCGLVLLMLVFGLGGGLLAAILSAGLAYLLAAFFKARFAALSGDGQGAIQQVIETFILLFAVASL